MNSNDPYYSNVNPYEVSPYQDETNFVQQQSSTMEREKPVKGEATWTDGGSITKCNIPWSDNHYMTAGVGTNSPYKCGEMLHVKNLSNQKEINVIVVDEISSNHPKRITLHRKAFEALGAKLEEGLIHIEIVPVSKSASHTTGRSEWVNYLVNVTRAAFPHYIVKGYRPIEERQYTPSHIQESFDFFLQSQSGTKFVRGTVLFDVTSNQVLSVDLKEL
ncbi:RlpA-like double-psi beta-barrel domain-containing protein [Pullulanibacillus sp. KACC 23026]|uniref:RlpA-like double-psi beta-barrel domain-containing protein n=1 Tax=Pullulanibacillus sp. KACC 23026 TaxID=3028315 RepID=UPI0023B06F3C|nr:RlpA-like double-psi beta-barrel domain-containing protein [Pullulanibacillus sp. KACC 23026]WEG11043.1 RlpA-like double-psi beta-barrel domain-containing protein [Pullulanibacillus sp. KACC 23026]